MVLTYVILVDCTISYKEIFFLVNGIWPVFHLLYRVFYGINICNTGGLYDIL